MTISKFTAIWAAFLLLAMAIIAEDEMQSYIQMTDDENRDAKSFDNTRLTIEQLRSRAQIELQYSVPEMITWPTRDSCRLLGELCNITESNVECCNGLVCLSNSCAIVFSPPTP